MPIPRIAPVSGLAAIAVLLTAAAAAFPAQPAASFALDLSPLHRVSTEPMLQAGTYAIAAPHGSHRHTQSLVHHHTL